MTEQTKIALPKNRKGVGPENGASLFERAEQAFGSGGFASAPVPKDLAKPVNSPVKRSVVAAKVAPVPAEVIEQKLTPKPVAPVAAAAPVATPAVQTAQPAPISTEPLAFPAEIHKVNRENLREYGLIQPETEASSLLEEFRIVRRQLLQSIRATRAGPRKGRSQRILICSPLPDEGKTFCATNLALAMAAEKDGDVLLVDADFAKPSILGLLGLPKGEGLMDALANPDINIEDCVIRTDIDGLSVLPAGNRTLTDSEYLSSKRTGEVLDRLTQGAPNRVVILDSPPALAASPAADLASLVGQALVVARADKTGQKAMEDALTLLSACPDIKLLLNAANFSPSGRRFGSYYGYGR